MRRKKNQILCVGVIIGIYLLSFPLNEWLSHTMPRHQLLQLLGMITLGILLGSVVKVKINAANWNISILVVFMASMAFWMLPRSIDLAVIHPWFNRLMHLNMVLIGFLLMNIYSKLVIELKILFLGMMSAVFMASGVTLSAFRKLLCSSFNLEQQHETGKYMIILAASLILFTLITFFRAPMHDAENRTFQ